MLIRTINNILAEPWFIPLYAFVAFMFGIISWEFIKLVIFVIRNTSNDKKK